jgi:hypothetical protein
MGRFPPVPVGVKVKQFFQNHKNGRSWICGVKPRPKIGVSGMAHWKLGIGNSFASKGLVYLNGLSSDFWKN